MLICSSFHDYYDTAISFGVDKSVVYNRKTEKIDNPLMRGVVPSPFPERFSIPVRGTYHEYNIIKFAVGFCGNIYPCVKILFREFNTSFDHESFFFYDLDALIEFLKDRRMGLDRNRERYWRTDYSVHSEMGLKLFFDKNNWRSLEAKFREHNCPVFSYGTGMESTYRTSFILNPNLKTYRFAKIKDPATAFQDIYMFISGVLGVPSRPLVEISDKNKAKKHGHDGEFSFRKQPGGGRWR